jgi:hypothetical protein
MRLLCLFGRHAKRLGWVRSIRPNPSPGYFLVTCDRCSYSHRLGR